MLQTKAVVKIETHFLFGNFLFSKNRASCEIMWKKYGTAGQAAGDNMARAHCILNT